MKIGVIGLGIIGGVWARHYEAAGRLAGAWNRTAQPEFPQWKESPLAVAAAADVVQIVVADPAAVRGVIERILPVLKPGKVVVQSSTIDPQSSEEFRAAVTATGASYLEAPFTGSKPAAEQKQSVFYLGGEAGLGMRFIFNRWMALRFELRDVIYREKTVGATETTGASYQVRNQLFFDIGLSFFFPNSVTEG